MAGESTYAVALQVLSSNLNGVATMFKTWSLFQLFHRIWWNKGAGLPVEVSG